MRRTSLMSLKEGIYRCLPDYFLICLRYRFSFPVPVSHIHPCLRISVACHCDTGATHASSISSSSVSSLCHQQPSTRQSCYVCISYPHRVCIVLSSSQYVYANTRHLQYNANIYMIYELGGLTHSSQCYVWYTFYISSYRSISFQYTSLGSFTQSHSYPSILHQDIDSTLQTLPTDYEYTHLAQTFTIHAPKPHICLRTMATDS